MEGFGNGECAEDGHGVEEFVGFDAVVAPSCEEFFDIGGAEIFAAGGFGRLELEVRVAKERFE